MFKVIQSRHVTGDRGYGYVLLWASSNPRPGYMLRQHMHWYRLKNDALQGAERMNKSIVKL